MRDQRSSRVHLSLQPHSGPGERISEAVARTSIVSGLGRHDAPLLEACRERIVLTDAGGGAILIMGV